MLLDNSAYAMLACLVIRLEIDAGELGWIAHGAAAALSATTKLGDLVSRLTTTDFAVVACDTDGIGARRLAERIWPRCGTFTTSAPKAESLLVRARAAGRAA